MNQPTGTDDDWDDVYPLERLRKKRTNLTQAQFAKEVGIRPTTYQQWAIYKKAPRLFPEQQRGVLRVLGLTIDEYCDLFADYED